VNGDLSVCSVLVVVAVVGDDADVISRSLTSVMAVSSLSLADCSLSASFTSTTVTTHHMLHSRQACCIVQLYDIFINAY